MDTRASLIFQVAKELFETEHSGGAWQSPSDKADPLAIKCQN